VITPDLLDLTRELHAILARLEALMVNPPQKHDRELVLTSDAS